MEAEKEVLIIEDLGIPQADFENKIEESGFSYKVIREEALATKEKVEGIITVKKEVGRERLEKYPNLKVVAVAFTGYDNVDLEFCRQHHIAVYNVPAYSTNSVVELTLGLSLSILREIPKAGELMHSGKWNLTPGIELAGKTVGILGTGEIGLSAAKIFKALGCRVLGWSRSERKEFTALGGEYLADKMTLFSSADLVSIHLPLNQKTKGIVGKPELSVMKETAYLINTARGPIVDEKALIEVLENRKIAGAGIDVFAQEPLPSDHPLLVLDNVILTPHIAFKTQEALIRRAEVTLANIKNFNDGKSNNRVDKL